MPIKLRQIVSPVALVLLAALAGPGCAGAEEVRAAVKKPMPAYPALARQMHIEGTILVRVVVLPDGRVGEILAATGHPLLMEAAKQAVRTWRFAPGKEATTELVAVTFLM